MSTKRNHTKTILARTLSVLYMLAVCFFCFANLGSTYAIEQSFIGIPVDKIAHFMMFFPFPILAFLSFEHKNKTAWESVKFCIVTLFAGVIVAASTEVIQSKLPYRSIEIADFYFDCLAILICSIYVLVVDLTRHKQNRN